MNKLSNTLPDKQSQESEESISPENCLEIEADLPTDNNQKDPTRFGDWEKNGRCIDF